MTGQVEVSLLGSGSSVKVWGGACAKIQQLFSKDCQAHQKVKGFHCHHTVPHTARLLLYVKRQVSQADLAAAELAWGQREENGARGSKATSFCLSWQDLGKLHLSFGPQFPHT